MRQDTAKHYRTIRQILREGRMSAQERMFSKAWENTWLFLFLIAWIITFSILLSSCAYSYSLDQWADCIRITEGNPNYGILSIKTRNPRQICKNTVLHAWHDFKGNKTDLRAFVGFLADRYCPFSADPVGNRNWNKNMLTLLRREK